MFLILVVALEIFSAILLSSVPHIKNTPFVLGTLIAQEAYVTPPDQPALSPSPADTTPTDTTPENPAADLTPPSPEDPFATASPDQYPPDISPSAHPQETQPPASPDQNPVNPEASLPENSPEVQGNTVDFTPSQTMALLAPLDTLSNPDALSANIGEKTQDEENQIGKQPAGEERARLLLAFAQDKIADLNQSLANNDFAQANFSALRLSDQVQQASLNALSSPSVTIQLKTLCKKADFTLRWAELVVPEVSEQDFEIGRGICLGIQL